MDVTQRRIRLGNAHSPPPPPSPSLPLPLPITTVVQSEYNQVHNWLSNPKLFLGGWVGWGWGVGGGVVILLTLKTEHTIMCCYF
jgi:hypothetical protein